VVSLIQDYRARYIVFFSIVLVIAAVTSIIAGTLSFSSSEVMSSLIKNSSNPAAEHVILNIRLPRIIIAAMIGCNLAIAGALLQGVLRNPLAAPQIIGVNSGAAFGAIAVMVLAPASVFLVPLAAFAGAISAVLTVYALAAKKGSNTGVTIVLAGVAVSAMLQAFTSGFMILHSDKLEVTYSWLLGGLSGRSWPYLDLLWPYTLLGTLMALYFSPKMNLFILGDEVGESLGLSIKIHRLMIIICASFLAASAVSVAGTIGFVGLVAPHTARLLVGNDYRYLTLFSGVLGALLMIMADVVARTVFQPMEIPVGIITAAIGAPFFLWLLFEKKNEL
jgi:iron complex transport system permease protein